MSAAVDAPRDPILWLKPLTLVGRDEWPPVAYSFVYFFCLLGGYFMLRPVREAMAVAGGVENIPWLFTATFIVMLAMTPLYGWLVGRFPRRVFLPVVYLFFAAHLVLFYLLFQRQFAGPALSRAFFVWLSVFNLFVVSVFWSFMVDLFTTLQARRLFGVIAAGGSSGAIAGPWLTVYLAPLIGVANLLLVTAAMLLAATFCVYRLRRYSIEHDAVQRAEDREALAGGVLDGVRRLLASPYLLLIAGLMLLHNIVAGFLYNLRAVLVAESTGDFVAQTQIFGHIDFTVNVLALLLQALVTVRLIKRFGMAATLAVVPVLLLLGFGVLGALPALLVVIVVQIGQRAMNYGLIGPAKEMLFTPVDRINKYKSKNFIDTVVYRGSDVAAGWLFWGLVAAGLDKSQLVFSLLPVLFLWTWLVLRLGRRYRALAAGRAA